MNTEEGAHHIGTHNQPTQATSPHRDTFHPPLNRKEVIQHLAPERNARGFLY